MMCVHAAAWEARVPGRCQACTCTTAVAWLAAGGQLVVVKAVRSRCCCNHRVSMLLGRCGRCPLALAEQTR